MNPNNNSGLPWPALTKGVLVRRYKRFMADVLLDGGELVTTHCPNSGSMKSCCEPGRPVYLSRSSNPKRRLAYTWELIEMPSSLVGVNTGVPNKLVRQSVIDEVIPELLGYESVRAEVRYGLNSRLDLLLESPGKSCFVEIKNCTLIDGNVAYFPDAVTTRGLKHLVDLQEIAKSSNRAVIFFLVQRMDASIFRPADHIDPAYGLELRRAMRNGVEILCYDVSISLENIALNKPLACQL
ncbi:MAG: DNA/RNA nuclease SfsA [Desulfomonile tiedjei]|uniref:Sugar fermentation stimulation protein homolog n=1 Tax=Desulfomonile tiedjei TaxID=2358 RepID=A0A9D6V3R7_9BACT|nr:DNA/RNA nuclease SfsA [Desulfomonile tiedjei]